MVGRITAEPLRIAKALIDPSTYVSKQAASDLLVPIATSVQRGILHFATPSEAPANVLMQMREASSNAINQAKKEGIQAKTVKETFKTTLEAELQKLIPANETQPEEQGTNWEEVTEKNRKVLCKKVTVFSAFLLMRVVCGISGDNFDLMNLVKTATSKTVSPRPSVWKVFTTNCKLSLFQKFKAGLVYFVCFKSSLISSLIDALLIGLVNTMKTKFTNRKVRSEFYRKLLKNVGDFLDKDNLATEEFATGKQLGPRIDCQMRAIKAVWNGTLKSICEEFSETRINQDSPTVEILQNLKDIWILGWFVEKYESFVNRQIIHRVLKSFVLPTALENMIKKGIAEADPDMIQYTMIFTQFLKERFTQLKETLEKGGSKPAEAVDGAENLPGVAKELMRAIALEGLTTRSQILDRLQVLDGKVSFPSLPLYLRDKMILAGIERGINDGGKVLFQFLEKKASSGELFALILALVETPFSGEKKSYEALKNELNEEIIPQLGETAEIVFKKVISDSVTKWISDNFNMGKPEEKKKVAKRSFEIRRALASLTFKQLQTISSEIDKKVSAGASEANDIQTDIIGFLEVIAVFARQKEIRDPLNELGRFDRDSVWWVVTPTIHKMQEIQKRVLDLQNLHKRYTTALEMEPIYQRAQADLLSRKNFESIPKPERTSLTQNLKSLEKTKLIIHSFRSLFHAGGGLLQNLFNFYNNGELPFGFDREICLKEIEKHIAEIPEAAGLMSIIGDGSNLMNNWEELHEILQPLYESYEDLLIKKQREIETLFIAKTTWAKEKKEHYANEKATLPALMKAEIEKIREEIRQAEKVLVSQDLQLPTPPTPSEKTSLLAGTIFAGIGAALGGIPGALGGGLMSKWMYPSIEKDDQVSSPGAIIKAAAGMTASNLFLGPLASLVNIGIAGKTGRDTFKVVRFAAEDIAFPVVDEFFEHAKRFFRRPELVEAVAVRTMIEFSKNE